MSEPGPKKPERNPVSKEKKLFVYSVHDDCWIGDGFHSLDEIIKFLRRPNQSDVAGSLRIFKLEGVLVQEWKLPTK